MGRNDSFDFAHTCPRIDKAIDSCKEIMQEYLSDYIKDFCPYMPEAEADKISKEWSKEIYNAISDCFEATRETNEEMRAEANSQIADLQDEIYSLKKDIKDLENQLHEMA